MSIASSRFTYMLFILCFSAAASNASSLQCADYSQKALGNYQIIIDGKTTTIPNPGDELRIVRQDVIHPGNQLYTGLLANVNLAIAGVSINGRLQVLNRFQAEFVTLDQEVKFQLWKYIPGSNTIEPADEVIISNPIKNKKILFRSSAIRGSIVAISIARSTSIVGRFCFRV